MAATLQDPASFSAAYDELYPLALRTADRVLRDHSAAEDVAQDVFTDLWLGRAAYDRSRGSLRSYVAMLTRSRALDRWRTRAARQAAAERLGSEVTVGATMAPGTEDQALLHDTVEDAVRALETVPDKQREAVLLAYAGGMTAAAIAETVGVPLGTAKSRIRCGLEQLRTQLVAS
jgi:RNA polymerase sigma-70 factor (ECF subfamily)